MIVSCKGSFFIVSVCLSKNFLLCFQAFRLQHQSSVLLDASDYLPHPTTVSRHVATAADSARQILAAELKEGLQSGSVAFTTDMWTDSYKNTAYSTVTAHIITSNFTMKSRVMCTDSFDSTQRKTGVNIKAHLLQSFAKFGIDQSLLQNAVYTTDKGSNILVALRDQERLDCFLHILNRVLQQSLEEKHCPPLVFTMITACKECVRYIKKTSLQDSLPHTVKQACETRWNTNYTMMESISSQYDELLKLFTDNKPRELHRITAINRDLLQELLQVLKPFVEVTKSCEGDKEPTLHHVIPASRRLKRHLEVTGEESDAIAALKEILADFFDKKFKPHLFHKVAIFFNPMQKSMRALPLLDRQLVQDYINEKLDNLPLHDHRQLAPDDPPPAKRSCHYNEFDDLPEEDVDTCELEKYQKIPHSACDQPILEWWKQNSEEFPALSRIARNILCIMASSAPSERNFSLAGHVVSSRRSSLKPSSVDNILFLNSSIKK